MEIMSRLFISIELEEQIKEEIKLVQSLFSSNILKATPTRKEHMHLTLKFLGDVKNDNINDIIDAMHDATESIVPFDMDISGVSAFPTSRNPRILWVGAHNEQLAILAANLDKTLRSRGISGDDKPFHPHITFMRVKEIYRVDDVNDIIQKEKGRRVGLQHVSQIHLRKSILTPSGPIYSSEGVLTL